MDSYYQYLKNIFNILIPVQTNSLSNWIILQGFLKCVSSIQTFPITGYIGKNVRKICIIRFLYFHEGYFGLLTLTHCSPPVCFVGEYIPWGCVREVVLDHVLFSHFSSLIYLVIRESHAFYSTFTLFYCLAPTYKIIFYNGSLKASVFQLKFIMPHLPLLEGGREEGVPKHNSVSMDSSPNQLLFSKPTEITAMAKAARSIDLIFGPVIHFHDRS